MLQRAWGDGLARGAATATALSRRANSGSTAATHKTQSDGERAESGAEARRLLDSVAAALEVRQPRDWARVRQVDISTRVGRGLLARHGGVLPALRAAYPELREEDWELRRQLPSNYWEAPERRRKFFLYVAREMGFEALDPAAWRPVTCRQVFQLGGRGLLKRHGYSLAAALQESFPGMAAVEVSQWRAKVPQRHWEEAANRRSFLEALATDLGLASAQDWRRVTHADVVARGGGALLQRHGSVWAALQAAFPEQRWEVEECRGRRPAGYWGKRSNRRAFFDRLAARRGVASAEDWAAVTKEAITEEGGRGLLEHFPSIWAALRDAYEGEGEGGEEAAAGGLWDRYLSRKVLPSGHWDDEEHVRDFVLRLQQRLHVTADEEWERVSNEQVAEVRGGGSLLRRMSLAEALAIAFPKKEWNFAPASTSKKAAQRRLRVAVMHIAGYAPAPPRDASAAP